MGTAPTASPRFPVLMTGRLVLRAVTPEDAPFWLQNFSAPEVVEFTTFDAPQDLEAAKAEIEQYCTRPFREGTGIRWGITLRGSPELIGTAGFYRWIQGHERRAQLGYDLLAGHRRKGIMTEALRVILAYGFKTMTLRRVEAVVDPRNEASVRLLEGLGFTREAFLRQASWFHARFLDDVVYGLLDRDWQSAQDAKP